MSCPYHALQAYIPEDLGVPKPFPAAFKPFKPSERPAAVTVALQRAALEAVSAADNPGGQQQLQIGAQASAANWPAPAAACAT